MTATLTFAPSRRTVIKPLGSARARPGDIARIFDPSGRGSVFWTSTARSALRPILLHLRRNSHLNKISGP